MKDRRTKKQGLELLLADPRFQSVDDTAARRIAELLPIRDLDEQPFDAVMTLTPVEPLTARNVEEFLHELRLVVMKTTRKPVKNRALTGFLFSTTEPEYKMANALGGRYLFAFVVLNKDTDYGRPFCELLTLEEVERRTRAKHFQYDVRSDFPHDQQKDPPWHIEAELGGAE